MARKTTIQTIGSSNKKLKIFTSVLMLTAIIVVTASAWAWWHYVRSNPKRVFEAMVANSLKTTGVTHQVKQTSGEQSLSQTIQYMTTPYNVVHANTTLSQGGASNASVLTETIGTPFTDYVRYLDVITAQKGADGKPLDFSKLIGVWGKTNSSVDGVETQSNGELFNETILGVIPVVNLPANSRNRLLRQINENNVYTPDYSTVERRIKNGRPEYTYTVSIKPEPYVAMLKQLAQEVGLTQLEQVNPANYANSEPLQFKISVDVWTRQLTAINFSDANFRSEQYSSYGVRKPVGLPVQTISVDELQQRLQSIE